MRAPGNNIFEEVLSSAGTFDHLLRITHLYNLGNIGVSRGFNTANPEEPHLDTGRKRGNQL
jgi:hypothetical protein